MKVLVVQPYLIEVGDVEEALATREEMASTQRAFLAAKADEIGVSVEELETRVRILDPLAVVVLE